jgi:cytochrome d ubiquinol oxidase subunit II
MMDLPIFWFVTLGFLLTGYSILDGFDLGVGALHLFARTDRERRLFINSIGPLWDGNEVWLVTFGGALFAAFPPVYATAFSAFYLPFILLLVFLIGRAVSIEFRSKVMHPWWRAYWDFSFAAASTLALLVSGVAVGNALRGIPLGADGEFAGSLGDLMGPYPLLVGAFTVTTAILHGAIFLELKTEGELAARIHRWAWRAFAVFLALYVAVTVATLVAVPHATKNFARLPVAWIIVALNVLAVANIPRALYRGRPGAAFVSSSATIAALVFLFGMALFPYLLPSRPEPSRGLDIYGAASSLKTLGLMQIIVLAGLPFVAGYTATVYWVFRGKTRLDEFSY